MDNNEHSRYDDGDGNDCIEEISLIDDNQVQVVYSAVQARNDNYFDFMPISPSKPRGKIYFIPRTTDIYGFDTKGITDWSTHKSVKIGIKVKKYIMRGRITVWALYDDLINISNASSGKHQALPSDSTLRGKWINTLTYNASDVVFHQGIAFYATRNNQGTVPDIDTSDAWISLALDDFVARSTYVGANSAAD
jgi:hypothetical protein